MQLVGNVKSPKGRTKAHNKKKEEEVEAKTVINIPLLNSHLINYNLINKIGFRLNSIEESQ